MDIFPWSEDRRPVLRSQPPSLPAPTTVRGTVQKPVYLDEIVKRRIPILTDFNLNFGAISTEHSASELTVIRTNDYRVDFYFLHLTMLT